MEFLRVICSAERRLVCAIHLARRKQAGIGPISQKPELVTMGLNYDDALDRTSFRQGAASSRLFLWSPPHRRVRPSFSGQRSIFLNGALFSETIFYFFGK